MRQISIKSQADPTCEDMNYDRIPWTWAHMDAEKHIEQVIKDKEWNWQPPDLVNFNVTIDDIGGNGIFKASCYGKDVYFLLSRESTIEKCSLEGGDLRVLGSKEYESMKQTVGREIETEYGFKDWGHIEYAFAAIMEGATHISWSNVDWYLWQTEKENAAEKVFGKESREFDWWFKDNNPERDDWVKDYELKHTEPNMNTFVKLKDYIRNYKADVENKKVRDKEVEGAYIYHYPNRINKRILGMVVAPHQLADGLLYLSKWNRCDPVNMSNLEVIDNNGGMKAW